MASLPPINPGVRMNKLKERIMNPSLSSFYSVVFPLPGFIQQQNPSLFDGELLELSCQEASLPGSSIATLEQQNDFAGVTERHAYRRVFDEVIDLTFYVDAKNYLPIKFFEDWISFITSEDKNSAKSNSYTYRVKYPDTYTVAGLSVTKFEKDYANAMTYQFIKSYPLQITSMPVSYDGSDLLKCSVAMTYIRYVVDTRLRPESGVGLLNILEQAGGNDFLNISSDIA